MKIRMVRRGRFLLLALIGSLANQMAVAETIRVVSWNIEASFYEGVEQHPEKFQTMNSELNPDIIVLVELAGEQELRSILKALDWDSYFAIVSRLSIAKTSVFQGLEFGVISKIPIQRVIEYDQSLDGVSEIIYSTDSPYVSPAPEEKKVTTRGISFIDEVSLYDRITMRVDLANGLTVFPVHLKSNRTSTCADISQAIRSLEKHGLPVDAKLRDYTELGHASITEERLSNARKRERAIAAVALVAEEAIAEGKDVVLAGDFNTSLERGKAGSSLGEDCVVSEFGCQAGPFPPTACVEGDGFDDTFGILEAGLELPDGKLTTRYKLISRNLKKTYISDKYSDLAIDHMAVPEDQASQFTNAKILSQELHSDHYPIYTDYKVRE